ncbi:MAG: pilus assembly PilX N-terminal domain-containing protein [Deltaproteobacteria bacterium]|nr:pilus assembly PilX N-terminal domain-containing protein [Deltaproteobacteria bacterium]
MIKRIWDPMKNERGMVLVVAVLILTVVTIIGIAALTTSDTELQISSNEKQLTVQFYDAEAGQIEAMEWRTAWMTDDFLTAGETLANFISDNATDVGNCDPADPDTWIVGDFDNDCNPDLKVEIRCVEETGTAVAGLTSAANDLPIQRHVGPPPVGSGYSLKHFEIRRYGVTSTSQDGNTRVQTGVYMVFNKF